MTDKDDFNIVDEAALILQEAANKMQDELCSLGDECGVHHRVDESIIEEESEFARLITYVDEFVVVTEDNHVLDDPHMLLQLLLGFIKRESLPDRFETSIYHVGEGAIWDLVEADKGMREGSLRYAHTHDEWEGVQAEHNSVVAMLREGMIDVSKALEGE